MNIADRIDTAMKMANIKTQADLARKSGVPESTVTRILKGPAQPSVDNLARIATACNVTMDWIVNGTDKPDTDSTEIPLVYVTLEELKLLTQFREATEMGKKLIKTAGNTAQKKSLISPTN